MGVGDMGIGKRVRVMAEAFFGRVQAYAEALAAHDRGEGLDDLRAALMRNLYRGQCDSAVLDWMAERVLVVRRGLAAWPVDKLAAGVWPQISGMEERS